MFFTISFLVGCTNKEQWEKFSFNIDISNLNYTLPNYTKICTPNKKQVCSSDGCENIQPTVFLAYDETNNMIYRCDNQSCDGYEITNKPSGLYTYIEPTEPRGFTVKISNTNEYTETVSMGLDTLVSYGTCK